MAKILTIDPVVTCIAEMQLQPPGLRDMVEWVRSRAPECIPDDYEENDWESLFPHDMAEEDRCLSDNELLVELAGRKCIAEGSLVLTDTGPVPIESLQDGARAVLHGKSYAITGRIDNGVKDIVVVETEAGYAVACTLDHMLHTEGGWVEAGDLKSGDLLTLNSGLGEWNGRGTLEAGYACGLFLGDGTFAGVGFSVANLRLFGDKSGLMSYVAEHIGAEPIPHRGGKALSINSKSWADELTTYGVKHGRRQITQEIECASSAFQRGVLMGLFDTDGSLEVSKKTKRIAYCSSNRSTLEAAQRMLLNFGIYSRLRLDRPAQPELFICGIKTQGKAAYKLTVTGASLDLFADRIGSRRRAQALRQVATTRTRKSPRVEFGSVLAVRPGGSARVYDISIESESPHAFSVNGIVAHNCYNSFGLKAGRKTNREYIAQTQQGDVPHASIMYHAKMTFFIAGVSRRVSHELIRHYVGADRTEEGSPSQESTRYVEHAGNYVAHPAILDSSDELGFFASEMSRNYTAYLGYIARRSDAFEKEHGERPKGMDRKRIFESASPYLSHACETSFVWTTNPIALLKMGKERDHDAADLEYRRLMKVWKKVCIERWPNLFPESWAAP